MDMLKIGWIVIGILAFLTWLEYLVAVNMTDNLLWLAIIAVAKGWLILHYFMHVSAVWDDEGDH